jgi:predicted ribosomally synthesized peptide with SipW-like signal peptide
MTKKKIGLLALALVLALGALGVGYAAWTDQITVTGTVSTGDLDIEAQYFSGTDIYKDLTTDNVSVVFWLKDFDGIEVWHSGTVPDPGVLVASAEAHPVGVAADDTVGITVTGAFPTNSLCADVIVHCVGSVPAKLTVDIASTDDKLVWLYENGYVTWKAQRVTIVDNRPTGSFSYTPGEVINPEDWPVQLENCEYLKIWLYLDLPQADANFGSSGYDQDSFMNITLAEFTATIDAIQWNKFGE